MNIDYLSQLPVDVFIQQITYLPFDEVNTICEMNTQLHNYCTNPAYNNKWRQLIDNTFGNIYDYPKYLKDIRLKLGLGEGVYNYLVYSNLVKLLDPITQLMIYYRQGDMESFNSDNFRNIERFLSLFLLGKKDEMEQYLPNPSFRSYIDLLNNKTIDGDTLDKMMSEFVKYSNIRGVKYLMEKGANIHHDDEMVLRLAIDHLDMVKFLLDQGLDPRSIGGSFAVNRAAGNNFWDVVNLLVNYGANIHTNRQFVLRSALNASAWDTVKLLVDHGANLQALNIQIVRDALEKAEKMERLDIVKLLVDHGATPKTY